MRAVFDAKAQYDAQKAPIDELVTQLAMQDPDLAAKRQNIQARLTELQALRSMPYVDRADLQIGDPLFYYSDLSHVTIYVGDGKVISAPMSGDVVRMRTLDGGSPIHSFGRPG